jgi:DNA-binding response OmpR family regulator
MPEACGVSSLDLLRTIRAESPRTIVHVLSSILSLKDQRLFIEEGASTFNSKPFLNAGEFESLLVRAKVLFEQLADMPTNPSTRPM